MTDVKDRLSIFRPQVKSSASAVKKKKPAPPPKLLKPSQPAHINHFTPPSVSIPGKQSSPGGSSGDRISKLSPKLLKKVQNLEQPAGLGGRGLTPAAMPMGGRGGGGKAKSGSPSPALKRKSTSTSKLPPKPSYSPGPGEDHAKPAAEMGMKGVRLLASITRDLSTSAGTLIDSNSFSTSSSSYKHRPSPPAVSPKKSSSTSPQWSRKAAGLSMDVSRINSASVSREKSPRPVSIGAPHRVTTTGSPTNGDSDLSPVLLRHGSPVVSSPCSSPSLTRRRRNFSDSFECSYSPPGSRRSPSAHTTSSHLKNTLSAHQPIPQSRSTDNILDGPSPSAPKQRSNSDSGALKPPLKKKPKPVPPPKKPGLVSKPPPPPKPHIKQLSKSPHFCRRVQSPESPTGRDDRAVTSPVEKPTSTLLDTQNEVVSPPVMSSPNATPLRGEISGVISPLPSTPSPLTSQLEAVRRNADSGFASETTEDLSSPIENKAPIEVWDEARLEKARNKRLHIAEELLKTEATYVERLHLIAVKFHGAVTEFNAQHKHVIPDGDVNRIFLNISQIHHLNTNILEELQQRMDTWSTQEGLGDVIERLAPFLKLYAHYTAGFEDSMKMLTTWTKREKKFDALVREFERELSTGLGVAHYMLEPVQRIPRYRLLLTDYLKYTPPDSPDRLPTEKALGIISEAADHSNDRIKELENSNTILSIQRSLQDFEGTLLAPGRLFIRRGQLQKFSRKTTTPRMFFLFSDILLHTEPAGTDVYKFKNEMPIFMMKVGEPVVSLVPHSFNVESTTRSLILVASSEAEKKEWMMELWRVISEERKKRSSLRRDLTIKVASGVFGAQAPIMVPDKSVTMCQTCSAEFTFTFRRHHCRGCGKVVCGNCSQWKAYLPYLKKFERVCEICNYISKSESGEDVDGPPPLPMNSKEGGKGILNLKAYEEDTIKGGYVLSQEGRKWNRLWYQLKQDFCLYKFRAHEDIKAMSSLPLPGYIVRPDAQTHTITLIHPSSKKELSDTFKLENPEDFDVWVLALESVVLLELPSLPSQSTISPPPDERSRSQSLRDLNAITNQGDNPLENSV